MKGPLDVKKDQMWVIQIFEKKLKCYLFKKSSDQTTVSKKYKSSRPGVGNPADEWDHRLATPNHLGPPI